MATVSRPRTRDASSRMWDGNRNGRSRTFPFLMADFGRRSLLGVTCRAVRIEPERSVHVIWSAMRSSRSCSSNHMYMNT
jgi:hypothetical protein